MKVHEFATQDNRNSHLLIERWLQKYIFTDQHEIFFTSFANELHEWFSKLAESKTYWKHDKPTTWT